jgi:nucleoside 2-deoxyribosyltransferase
MKPLIYIAGPLFTIQDRKFLEGIRDFIQTVDADTFLPHIDNMDNQETRTPDASREKMTNIFLGDITAVDNADAVIAFLDGVPVDVGTAVEVSHAHATSKPVLGIRSDFRTLGAHDYQCIDPMVFGCCTEMAFIPDGNMDTMKQKITKFIQAL